VFVRGKPFQPSLMFDGKAFSLPYNGASEKCFTQVGFGLTRKQYTRLERLDRDQHCNLLQKFVNYSRKKVLYIDTRLVLALSIS